MNASNSNKLIIKKESKIKMKFNIEKNDINKASKLLYNIGEKIINCDIGLINETNAELYINNKKYKYKSYFIPEKDGLYDIELKINFLIDNCCCLFYDLNNLQTIDLSFFDTSKVTNMSFMFNGYTI